MIVTPDIRFIDYLFKGLWQTATDKQIPTHHHIKALGTLSESAVFYYPKCDTVVDLVYEECLTLIKDPVFSVEVVTILWLMFDYYRGKLGDKKRLKKEAVELCLKTIHAVLEKGPNSVDNWIAALQFLTLFKIESNKVLYEKFSPTLFRIVTEKHEPVFRIEAFNLLIDLFPHDKKIKSATFINQGLEVLQALADDITTPPFSQLTAIRLIMANAPQKMAEYFYKLFDFTEHADVTVSLDAWAVLFKIHSAGLPGLEDMGHQFIQRILDVAADNELEQGLRLKAIDFMMKRFKQNAYGFSAGEIHAKAYIYLLELVKTEQFLLSDYLESLRLYFSVMSCGFKKPLFIQQSLAFTVSNV